MAKGWIKLHRELTDHWLWEEKPFDKKSAWIDLLLMANHEEKKVLLGSEVVTVERGGIITSELKLSERWGWSRTKVRSFLETLEKDLMITVKKDSKKTAINIVNFSNFQNIEPEKDSEKTSKEHQKNIEETSKEHQKDTNKNVKKYKNEKNEKKYIEGDKPQRTFVKPSLENVIEYCQERGNSVDAERFIDYYESNGWMVGKNKMKDWKAAVRNWERQYGGSVKGGGNGKHQGAASAGSEWAGYNGIEL